MECYMGMVTTFAFNFTPMYFAACNGQLLSIQQNSALYALLGNNFGGSQQQNTFGVPDLRGRAPVHVGPTHAYAQPFGQDNMTLTATQLPTHSHALAEAQPGQTVTATATATVNASNAQGDKLVPTNFYWAKGWTGSAATTNFDDTKNVTMASDAVQVTVTPTFNKANLTVGTAGSGAAFSLAQPSLALNFCICTSGLFPSRT